MEASTCKHLNVAHKMRDPFKMSGEEVMFHTAEYSKLISKLSL